MGLSDLLSKPVAAPIPPSQEEPALTGPWAPSVKRAGDGSATLVSPGLPPGRESLDKYLTEMGFDPKEWMLKPGSGVVTKRWTGLRRIWNPDIEQHETVTVDLESHRIDVVPRLVSVDVDELVRHVQSAPPATVRHVGEAGVFGVAIADWQTSKALADDTPVLTPSGWTTHGQLKPGDYVYAPNGKPVKVLEITGSTETDLYDVEFDRGVTLRASADHLWQGVRRVHPHKGEPGFGKKNWVYREHTMTTRELADLGTSRNVNGTPFTSRPLQVDVASPIQFGGEKGLPIDPYLLGFWLGNGHHEQGLVVVNRKDADDVSGLGHYIPSGERPGCRVLSVPGLRRQLIDNGLLGNKHVPEAYKWASIEQRLALVQGLMDSDGTCTSAGLASYASSRHGLALDFYDLITSLGFKATVAEREARLNGESYGPSWVVSFATRPGMPVFRVLRKHANERADPPKAEVMRRQVQRVAPVGRGSAQCIKVEGSLYLAGRDLVTTHNSENPIEELLDRIKAHIHAAVGAFYRSGKTHAHIAFLGDELEGVVSQGGRNMWRTSMTITEQTRVVRRMMLWCIDQFVDAGAEYITVVAVPSNHGQAQREPVSTRADDDWSVECLIQVGEVMASNEERYGGVQIYVAGDDEAEVVVHLDGLIVAHAHGHLIPGFPDPKRVMAWLAGHALSRHSVGQADLLLTGHGHHHQIAERSGRMWCMVPSMEAMSTWWRQKTGDVGSPGVVIFETSGGHLEYLTRLTVRSEA